MLPRDCPAVNIRLILLPPISREHRLVDPIPPIITDPGAEGAGARLLE